MDRGTAIALTLAVGAGFALQAPINSAGPRHPVAWHHVAGGLLGAGVALVIGGA